MSTARIDELRAKFEENPRRYFAPLANEYRKAGDLTQAIALCREHLPKQPGHMSGHIVFGQALFESGELSEAQTVFQAALDLDPENLIALRHLGDIARERGDDPLARRWYERVLDADPRNDDIAALLSTLTARHTPQATTPINVPAVSIDPPVLDLDAMSDSDSADDPFSAPDSPAWHTPSFLTPLASAAVPPANDAAVGSHEAPGLTGSADDDADDVDAVPSDEQSLVEDAPVGQYSDHANVASYDADLLDLDFSSDADAADQAKAFADAQGDDATGDEVHHESDVATNDAVESSTEGGLHDATFMTAENAFGIASENASDNASEHASATASENASDDASDNADEDVAPDTVASETGAATADASEPLDVLSAALGAFASHDIEDVAPDAAYDAEYDADYDVLAQQSHEPAAFVDEADAFEEGLVAQDWPDTSALTTRTPTPAHAELPIVPDAGDDELVLASDTDALEATDAVFEAHVAITHDAEPEVHAASIDDGEPEAPVAITHDAEPEAHIAIAGEVAPYEHTDAADDVASYAHVDEADDVAAPIAEAFDASLEPGHDATGEQEENVLVSLDDTVSVHAHIASGDDMVDTDDDTLLISSGDALQANDGVSLDEDPPVSSADMPWLSLPETEREADELLVIDEAEPDALPVAEHTLQQDAEPDAEPSTPVAPAAAPAFVTETMAELLVAQGFVARAIDVYEELITRRPYDAVLTFRLQELRAMLAEEAATPVHSGTPVHAFTPVQSATPVNSGTPVRSQTPVADIAAVPLAVPFAAPPARRTARELFASLASMRVARRTPAYGSATVAMPTPADGLASLFGESPAPADDLTARAMARAFGSGDDVEAGPSMFTPSVEGERTHRSPTPVAVPPVPSAPAFSFDRFFPDPATSGTAAQAVENAGASQAAETAVPSGSGEAPAAGPSSAGADLAHFSQWLKGLSNS